jgi:hypothetical protein
MVVCDGCGRSDVKIVKMQINFDHDPRINNDGAFIPGRSDIDLCSLCWDFAKEDLRKLNQRLKEWAKPIAVERKL